MPNRRSGMIDDMIVELRREPVAQVLEGQTVEERLAIEQIVGEGNALAMAHVMAEEAKQTGDERFAEILDFVVSDEASHVGYGRRWVLSGVDNSPSRYADLVRSVAARVGAPVPACPGAHP